MDKEQLVQERVLMYGFIALVGVGLTVTSVEAKEICEGYGPQSPRDITQKAGTNKQRFAVAPSYREMNLCNLHFHEPAEHKAKAYSLPVGSHQSQRQGYQCNLSQKLTKKELKPLKHSVCNGLKPGDTIEVHWVFSSCAVKPGQGLGSCLSKQCSNPNLRGEAQVFTLVNDSSALNFKQFTYHGDVRNGYYQPKALPRGSKVNYLGSTTGPQYTDQQCSALQVSWSVRKSCKKLNINSLGQWCKQNVFKEHKADGIRKLVINKQLLAKM